MADLLVERQREFFQIVEESFELLTGTGAASFADLDGFSEKVNQSAPDLAVRLARHLESISDRLKGFYTRYKALSLAEVRGLGGMKLVLGGGSRFLKSQLDSVRQILLYADTVLIADPILPWIEVVRKEERFRHVAMLQQMFFLLRLKSLIDADLAYPPVVVFQSWEKSLEDNDEVTKQGIDHLISNVISDQLGDRFDSLADIFTFARSKPQEFLKKVDARNLFVGPGGTSGQSVGTAIDLYRKGVKTWRTDEAQREYLRLSDAETAIVGISERIRDQYHIIENANQLYAQPYFSLAVHAHYFSICANASASLLEKQVLLSPATASIVQALSRAEFNWLTNVPLDALILLRRENANEAFRKNLASSVEQLANSSMQDLDRTAAEIAHRMKSLLNSHAAEAAAIEEKYKPKFQGLALSGWLAVGAALIPALAPLVATIAPLGLGVTYASAKLEQRSERRKLARSMTGVLAAAARR